MEKNTENFADKMKKLRLKKKVSLEELEKKTGYSVEYLSQIENNEMLTPVSVILSVSQSLSIPSEDLLLSKSEKQSHRKNSKQRKESFEKRSESYCYKVLTPQGNNKHLNAFKVTINPNQDHEMIEYHHSGEEFIYVLSGVLQLKVGQTTFTLKPEESMHFDSSKAHKLWSVSEEPTQILVTIYSP